MFIDNKNKFKDLIVLKNEKPPLKIKPMKDEVRRLSHMLQASTVITDTKFEGTDSSKGFEFWKLLIEQIQENTWIEHGVEEERLNLISSTLDSLTYFEQIIKEYFPKVIPKDSYSNKSPKEGIELIFERMNELLEKNRVCYFPSGWATENSGHHMILKIRRLDEKKLAISFLNKGEGAQYHAPVVVEGLKEKSDYQSPEISVDKEDFFKKGVGTKFLSKLVKLLSPVKNTSLPPHEVKDAYGLLAILGHYLPQDQKLSERRSGTSQRSGTCVETNTRLIVRDLLIDCEPEKYKKLIFSAKLYQLAQEFTFYQQEKASIKDPEAIHNRKKILEVGAHELLTRLMKEKDVNLSEEEWSLSLSIAQEILCELGPSQDELSIKNEKPSGYVSPISDKWETTLSIFVSPKNDVKAELKTQPFGSIKILSKNANASEICKVFREGAETLQKIKKAYGVTRKTFSEIFTLFRSLPPTSGEWKDSFWDKLTDEQEIKQFIKDITFFAKEASSLHFNDPYITEQTEIFARAYDLAAQLAPKKACQISSFGFDYKQPCLKGVHWHDVTAIETLERIKQNFKKRTQDKIKIFSTNISFHYNIPENFGMDHYILQFINDNTDLKNALFEDLKSFKIYDNQRTREVGSVLLLMEGKGIYKEKEYVPLYKEFVELSNLAHLRSQEREITKDIVDDVNYALCRETLTKLRRENWVSVKLEGINYLRNTNYYSNRTFTSIKRYSSDERIPYNHDIEENNSNSYLYRNLENSVFRPGFKMEYSEWTKGSCLPPRHLEELMILRYAPRVQAERTCNWGADHVHLLADSEVREKIEALIFESFVLASSLKENREVMQKAIDSFLEKVACYYDGHPLQVEIYCWLSSLSDYFEKYCPDKDFKPLQTKIDSFLEPHLKNPKNRYPVACALAHHFFAKEKLSLNELKKLLVYFPIIHSTPKEDTILIQLDTILPTHRDDLIEQLKAMSSNELNQWCNGALIYLFPQEKLTDNWAFENDYLKNGSYAIHPETLLLYKNQEPVSHLVGLSQRSGWEHFRTVFEDRDDFPSTVQGEFRIALDGNHALKMRSETGELLPNMILKNHDGQWWRYVQDKSKMPEFPMLHAPLKSTAYLYWVNKQGHLLITDKKRTPLYQQKELLEKRAFVSLLDGKYLLSKNEEWKSYFEKKNSTDKTDFSLGLENPNEVLFKGNSDGMLSSIEMTRLGLSWRVEGNQFYCEQFPDFIWQQKASPYLNGLPQAFYLKNPKTNEEKVIIPCWEFKNEKKNTFFSLQPSLEGKLLLQNSPYFVFGIDRNKKILTSSEREANLYLALLYRGQKDYVRAMQALKRATSNERPSLLANNILAEAFKQKELSPSGCAFDCQLADFCLLHWDKQSKSGAKFEEKEKFQTFAYACYNRYCQVKSGRRMSSSAIPDYLLLSVTQEERLAKKLHVSKDPFFNPYLIPFQEVKNKNKAIEQSEFNNSNNVTIPEGATRVEETPKDSLVPLHDAIEKNGVDRKIALLDLQGTGN